MELVKKFELTAQKSPNLRHSCLPHRKKRTGKVWASTIVLKMSTSMGSSTSER